MQDRTNLPCLSCVCSVPVISRFESQVAQSNASDTNASSSGTTVLVQRYSSIEMVMMEGSPFFDQLRVAHWDMRLEFDTGQKVYTHRFILCAAFQFFEGLCETEIERYFYKMPSSEDQPVTADMLCLMLSFLYEDWHIPGVTKDRTKAVRKYVEHCRGSCCFGCAFDTSICVQVLGYQESC